MVLTPRKKNFSKWYNELIIKSGLAENSDIRGCMIIKPYGFALWEKIQFYLDKIFKNTGHQNVYFPLFIPKSFFSKEAKHINKFAKECAVVTHYRLKKFQNSILVDPKSRLEEELIIRPSSETIIWETYRKWIISWRDLPILLNQWGNVVRWEMRPRLFLRTSEFLWQEGHTAHASINEAIAETKKIIYIYYNFVKNFLSIPSILGLKTTSEKFAGAADTYCIETIMQDGKAIQTGTSHFLGQNFSKAFNVKFTNKHGKQEYVWATSWGVSTRLIGALIMTHSDDYGLVLPPKIAPIQVVIIPVYHNNDEFHIINKKILSIQEILENKNIFVKYDNLDKKKPGWKFNEHEIKGVPIRITLGPKDIRNNEIEIFRRDISKKQIFSFEELDKIIPSLLNEIQTNLYNKALKLQKNYITEVNDYKIFKEILKKKRGFISAYWDGTSQTEEKIKNETNATIRCIPLSNKNYIGNCIYSGRPSKKRVLFAYSY